MKTAIYIEDGVVQLVITPESKFEREAMASFKGDKINAQMFRGSFYDCRGGWVRQKTHYPPSPYENANEDNSLILRMSAPEK